MDYTAQLETLTTAYNQLLDDELRDYRAALNAIDQVYRVLPDSPERPPTFPEIVGRTYDENFISDYLAYILDPARNGIGHEPLQALLDLAGFDDSDVAFDSVDIKREFTFSRGGRIDFIILVGESLLIGIENKITSLESHKQTLSYEKSIEQEFKDRDHVLIYLAPGEQTPRSKAFHHISYSQLHQALRQIKYAWTQDVRRSFFWEDFLTHLEEYIAMNKGLPEVSEKTKLYLQNIKMARDIQTAFERDSQQIYDYLTTKILASYEGGDWKHSKQQYYQFMRKHTWKSDEFRVFFIFRFHKEILRKDNFVCSLEVQGLGNKWNKSPHIDAFIELLIKLYPSLPDEIKSRQMQYRPGNIPWAVAYKPYDLKPDPEYIDKQFGRASEEFSFLIAPVDKTMAEYLS